MTSDFGATECYVYMTLPGETSFVTAGKFALTTDRLGVVSGKFVYGRSYLARANAVPLDPIELKLGIKTHETRLLDGVFGALRDASPDYWGRRVIERHSGKTQLGEIDYLLYSPDDRAGALGFGLNAKPPAPRRVFNQTINLERVQVLADAIVADENLPDEAEEAQQAQDLMLAGTSMGGARPKAVVEDSEALWIAKFNRPDDKWNHARVEHAMLVLGRESGLHTAQSKLVTIGDRVVLLVEELRRISAQPSVDAPELFRRMAFNALISNTDDHPRNHAVIAMNTDWRLSPAYDLTPATPISIERRDLAMACGDEGRHAHAENLLSQNARFLLPTDEARKIVKDMERAVKNRWYEVARGVGVCEQDCQRLAGAFAYEGFSRTL